MTAAVQPEQSTDEPPTMRAPRKPRGLKAPDEDTSAFLVIGAYLVLLFAGYLIYVYR